MGTSISIQKMCRENYRAINGVTFLKNKTHEHNIGKEINLTTNYYLLFVNYKSRMSFIEQHYQHYDLYLIFSYRIDTFCYNV